ncbi:phosphatidylinositol 4-phosphate 5-kinase 6-like protein [Tanacetum coccineum]
MCRRKTCLLRMQTIDSSSLHFNRADALERPAVELARRADAVLMLWKDDFRSSLEDDAEVHRPSMLKNTTRLSRQVDRDYQFLKHERIMDYILLVGISVRESNQDLSTDEGDLSAPSTPTGNTELDSSEASPRDSSADTDTSLNLTRQYEENTYNRGTEEGVAVATVGAEVHTGTVSINGDMEAMVIAEGMMTGTWIDREIENTTTRVGQGGTGAQAIFIGGNVAIQK